MQRPAVGVEDAFVHHLAQRRVREDGLHQLFFGRLGSTKTRHEQTVPIMNFFMTSDEHWLCIVARQGESDWAPICKVIGREDLIEDERFNSAKARRKNSKECVDILDEGFARMTREEAARRLDEHSIAWSPVQTLAEAAEDEQVKAAGGIVDVPSSAGDGSTFASPASPVRFPGANDGPKGPAPKFGEHTRAVLGALGRDESEIAQLLDSGVVSEGKVTA